MRFAGIILMILGAVALVIGGVNYSRQHTVLEVGSFKATATEQRHIPLSPIIGGVVLLGGIVLFASPKGRLA
jgi:hypothetical protein